MFTKTEKKLSSAYVFDLIPTDFNSIVKTHKSQADLQHAFPLFVHEICPLQNML